MATHAIGEYALLSDCNGAALVHRDGSIDWLCLPRFDSPAVFARLLDEKGGHFAIHPAGEFTTSRRYLDGTMALETRFSTDGGELVLVDALAVGPNKEAHGHDLGAEAPHALLRELRCTSGQVHVAFEYVPRPEYGLIASLLGRHGDGISGRGGASVWMLSGGLEFDIDLSSVHGEFTIKAGECRRFSLQHAAATEPVPQPSSHAEIGDRLEVSLDAWRHWSEMHQAYEGPWRDLIHHSGRLLQALTYYPTGAIVAAPTTSLPEQTGGDRNWDYRFTWVRDASFTLDALWVAACPDEAHKFIDFLSHAALTKIEQGHDMQIMYGVAGEHDLSEHTIDHLSGWRNSAPVRVGNQAWQQRQIDVYGELLAAVDLLRDQLDDLDMMSKRFLVQVAEAAARCWKQADQGIWEVRAEPRHYLYSKLMCWVALDRASNLAGWLDATDRIERWEATRAEIREAIMSKGFHERVGAFTQSFGSDALDAAALTIPMVGFLPAGHPKVLSTIDAVERHLTDDRGLVYRYRSDDGLAGEEGAFLLCTFWLARARALAGHTERAREIFEATIAFANDLGLLSEEIDPHSDELLGNFPQAFSHVGLINAAWAIHQAEQAAQAGAAQ